MIPNDRARAVFLSRHLLDGAPSGPGKGEDLMGVVDALGFVQLDSIQYVERAHDMILHARRTAYRPRALGRMHEGGALFEHWTHDASLIPSRFFPHWRLRFARNAEGLADRWERWGRAGFRERLDGVLRRIADEGPLCSADVGEGEARSLGGWWDWHPSKAALEYLWRTGELAVSHRTHFRKFYDLTERVIPPEHLNARFPDEETVAWACEAALDRLGFGTPGELAAFFDLIRPAEAKAWAREALASGTVVETEVEGVDGVRRKTLTRPATLDEIPPIAPRMRVLSPFDPALRDRSRAERLFGFRYRIEIFVPEAKREYGYYVFPVIEGTRMVGRVDMKAERKGGYLDVRAFWPERGVRMGSGRLERLRRALDRTARLAGVPEVRFEEGWLRQAR